MNNYKKVAVMRNLVFILFLLGFSLSLGGHEYRDLLQNAFDIHQVRSSLVPGRKWVPYPDYNNRQGWDDLTARYRDDIIRGGEEALDYEWRIVRATDYLEYDRSGSREVMQEPFFANYRALSSLVMAELAEGRGRFTDQIVNGIWLLCEMTTWSLSAHIAIAEKTDDTSLPSHKENIIDLDVGNLGSFLSWTYYFLKDELARVNPLVPERLLHNLQVRLLDPFMERDDFHWQAFNATPATTVNNWNPWCNFNVLSAFLLLEDDIDKLAGVVYRSMISVDKFTNFNHADGACEEGPSYWGHAAGKLYDYLQILYMATDGRISIFDEPMIRNMGEYIVNSYIGNGWVVNFADATARGGGNRGVILRYGQAVNSEKMQKFAAYLYHRDKDRGYSAGGTDFFRGIEDLRSYDALTRTLPSVATDPWSWYPQTGFCYMRNNTGFFFAAKGGYNAESHNHNDAGSFILYYDASPVFIDVGVGTYTRQTFSSERYTIWTMQSDYHNLPMINGAPQLPGRQYRAKNVDFDHRRSRFSLDISDAYGEDAAVDSWVRTYTLPDDGGLVIEDAFVLREARQANRLNFMTHAKPDISASGVVVLVVNGEKVELSYDPGVFDAMVETIAQTDRRLINVWGDAVYRLSLIARNKEIKGSYRFNISLQ